MKRFALLSTIYTILAGGFILAQADSTPNPAVALPAHPATAVSAASGITPPAYPTQPGAPSRPTVTSPNALSPQEWQEINAARAAAIKANPALMQKGQELSAKMRAFQLKLDAAIVKADPNAASIVARIEQSMPGQRPPGSPQGSTPSSPANAVAPASNH